MREGVDVHARLGDRLGVRARVRGDDVRLGQPRRELGGLGELGGELAEGEVLRLVLDQAVRRDVPERGGAAVAEDHLVAVGELEQLTDALAHLADQVLDRGLPVGGAHEGGAGGGEGVQRLCPHLGGTRAETSVGGLDVSGNLDLSHAGERSRFRKPGRNVVRRVRRCPVAGQPSDGPGQTAEASSRWGAGSRTGRTGTGRTPSSVVAVQGAGRPE